MELILCLLHPRLRKKLMISRKIGNHMTNDWSTFLYAKQLLGFTHGISSIHIWLTFCPVDAYRIHIEMILYFSSDAFSNSVEVKYENQKNPKLEVFFRFEEIFGMLQGESPYDSKVFYISLKDKFKTLWRWKGIKQSKNSKTICIHSPEVQMVVTSCVLFMHPLILTHSSWPPSPHFTQSILSQTTILTDKNERCIPTLPSYRIWLINAFSPDLMHFQLSSRRH